MNFKIILRMVVAIVVGEIALVVLTTIAQEVLFDGIGFSKSSAFELIFGGLATFIASVLAGVVASLVIVNHRIVPLIISVLITVETSLLIMLNKTSDPLWFDIIAGSALIVGVWMGYYLGSKKLLRWKNV